MARMKMTLELRPCTREGCPISGEMHPKCKAHTRSGKPCMGQVMTGQLVCRMHGGQQPSARRAGRERVALQEAGRLASRIVEYDADDPETPVEGLLREIRWSGQIACALAAAMKTAISDERLTTRTATGERVNSLLQTWQDERALHARLCKMALDAGVDQRELDLIESQAGQIVSVMLGLLQHPRLGLSAEQMMEGRRIAAELMRSQTSTEKWGEAALEAAPQTALRRPMTPAVRGKEHADG